MLSSPTADLRLRRRPLHLKRRRNDGNDLSLSSSLFARLSRSAVNRLYTDALCRRQQYEGSEDDGKEEEGWNVFSQQDRAAALEFLPLSIKFSASSTIYVSYNGGEAADSSKDGDVLELPCCMIPEGLSLTDNAIVQVAALPFIRNADILNVEPLSVEDWDLLETRADFLEEGALLRQVSVVYANQKLPLWVGGKDIAWVNVLLENFSSDQGNSGAWPQDNSFASEKMACLRLVANTRFCVIPKTKEESREKASPPFRVYPTTHDYAKPMIKLAESLGSMQVSTTPNTALIHPDTTAQIPGWRPEDKAGTVVLWNTSHNQDDDSIVIQIATNKNIPLQYIAIHPATRSRIGVIALVSTVQLKLLSPVEVARGATLFHQINLTHENKLVLERVTLNENNAAAKWRYPYIQQNLDRPITANIDLISACPNNVHLYEPIEVGSFVQRRDETGDSCLYRLAKLSSSTKTDDAEASNAILSSDEKCFLPLAELSDLLLDLMQNTKAKFKLQLEQKRHLLNLLPPTSIQCSELQIGSAGISCHDTIIYGDSGSGKTHTALFLAARARFLSHTSTFYLDCKRLKEGRNIRMTHILSELHGIFHDAKSSSGSSLIILDDFAELAPNFEDSSGADGSAQLNQVNLVAVDQSKLIADTTRLLIEAVAGTDKSVAVIITARDVRSLPPSILSTRPFLRTIKSPSLSGAERESLLWRMLCSDRPDMLDEELCADYLAIHIGRKTEAYRPKDLQILAARARHQLETTGINYSVVALAKSALIAVQDFTPMRLLSSNELTSSAAEWSDIGGLFKVKEELTTTVMNPTKYCRIYEMAKIRLPRGLLLFGPPGTGKSHVVPALAKKCGFCLVTCRGPELLDRYIGASESKVRELFDRARASAPSILFFDEIDSLAPRRGSDKTGVTDRVVNQLLTLLDGVEDTASVGLVYIVAATSRPDIVDPALLRPGRLEKHIYVGYSENDKELNDLLVKVAARYPIDTETFDMIKSGRLTEEMYHSLPHSKLFSAADYKAAFDTAQLSAIHDLLQCDKGDAEVSIRYRHLVAAVGATRPSLPQRDYTALMEAYRPFRKDITEQSGDGDLTSAANAHYRKSARKDLRTALR